MDILFYDKIWNINVLKRTVSIDTNKCSYIFHNDKISSSGDKDFSIIHKNTRSFNKKLRLLIYFIIVIV